MLPALRVNSYSELPSYAALRVNSYSELPIYAALRVNSYSELPIYAAAHVHSYSELQLGEHAAGASGQTSRPGQCGHQHKCFSARADTNTSSTLMRTHCKPLMQCVKMMRTHCNVSK